MRQSAYGQQRWQGLWMGAALAVVLSACDATGPQGLAPTPAGTGARVRFDATHRPLPEIPLPNDFATRYDASAATGRRLNASMVAPTEWERLTREDLDQLDGWGTLAPITVSFDAPLDVTNIVARHTDRFDHRNDALLVIDISDSSPDRCKPAPVDLGGHLFPLALDRPDYYPDDPRGGLKQLLFEEVEEDVNGNGQLDAGEDTDMDGVLDHPNTGPDGQVLDFYERETHTLIAKPVMPLREGTTYAVVLTRHLRDATGQPVRSPFDFVHHASQTEALRPLPGCLQALGMGTADVAFAWTFTTQRWTEPYRVIRDGLYGLGPLQRLQKGFATTISLRDLRDVQGKDNPRLVPSAQFVSLAKQLLQLVGAADDPAALQLFLDNFGFIDFTVMGSIASPQFFDRVDAAGKPLPLTRQVWHLDEVVRSSSTLPRSEAVPFWLMVPKHRKGPAPVAVFVHGHGGSKFDALLFAGFLARQGIATLSIDAPGHGVGLDPGLTALVEAQFKASGLGGMAQGLLSGRALDQNGDGVFDPGADYWTSYIFHTRDMVRQTAVDVMQVVRMVTGLDNQTRGLYDANGDGTLDLAGDFDGDGTLDIGGGAPVHIAGGSLGGIITSLMAGLEPKIDAAAAIIAGGVLSEVGTRSSLGGVRDAMVLRMMGPILLGGDGKLRQMVPDLTDGKQVEVAPLPALTPGHIVVARNLDSGEWRCARVQPSGRLRVAVPSDKGDRLRLEIYDRELASRHREGCTPQGQPLHVVEKFAVDATLATETYKAGTPLVALGDGFGLRRGNPELRRMLGIAQVALDGADPANAAPFIHRDRTLTYGTGETVGSRILYLNTVGDSGVPTATGVALARAAGLIEFRNVDPRYGKTVQEVMVDSGLVEGVESSLRHLDKKGNAVLLDPDHLGNLVPPGDGLDVPRLDPPLRLLRDNPATVGGKSGILFPMMSPQGVHSFPTPSPKQPFDLGSLLINQFARYLATRGEQIGFDTCQLDWTCGWLPPLTPKP